MSTQQVLGVVGGVVGSFFGYPQLGFVVGSLVGGLLTPAEKTQGPRVDDLKVQVSTYGAGIPILYGTERVGGNVVWSTDKIETETTTGGKGGEPESTTYRYFVHMGIVLCETPRDGSDVAIIQIFQDGKLIYDARSGIPVASALASAENPHAFFVLYQGRPDQLPDAIEELYAGGPGTVPAYRGVVRIRMNAVECPGGRVPQFSFVLSASASVTPTIERFNELPGTPASYTGIIGETSIGHVPLYRQGGDNFKSAYEVGVNYTRTLNPQRTEFSSSTVTVRFIPVNGSQDAPSSAYSYEGTSSGMVYSIFNNATGAVLNLLNGGHIADGRGEISAAAFDTISQHYAFKTQIADKLIVFPGDLYSPSIPGTYRAHSFRSGQLSVAYQSSASPSQMRVMASRLDGDFAWTFLYDIQLSISSASVLLFHSDLGLFACVDPGPTLSFYTLDSSGAQLLSTVDFSGENLNVRSFFSNNNYAIYGPSTDSASAVYQMIRHRPLVIGEARVIDIIADQCDRAGESRIDIAGMPSDETLHGYKLQNPASARANIDPLLTAFAAFIVDEDEAIKFKKFEDIAPVAGISYDELGQGEAGADGADAMPLNRAQEIDLPRSVAVSYIEPLKDYQTATEKEVRQITEANEDLVVELPIATTSDHAKSVASLILFNRWRSQNTRSFKTSRKYAFVSPGDGLTVEYPRGTLRLWRVTKTTDTGAFCEFDVEPGDSDLYQQTAIGAAGYVGQEVAPLAPPTQLQLLDIPILRDADNNAGIYAALAGYGSSWAGAELFVGDDEATLQSRGTVQNEAPMGFAETALSGWALGLIDESNLLTVNVGHHTLNSITQDLLLTGQANVAALGAPGRWEILKFQRVNSLGSGRYILSGLMRGQRGTEWAAGLHQANDIFVVLSLAGVLRPNLDVGSIGQSKAYRAITKGRSINSASSELYANTAEGLETFSPTNLTRATNGADITLVWVRRTRLSENWLAGIVPLGEVSERFETVLYTSNSFATVRRVIASTSRAATYTAAMQGEDGFAGGPLYVRVYQLSDAVGRGHPLEVTI